MNAASSGQVVRFPPQFNRGSLAQAATEYARMGWEVFPVKPKTKLPLVKWKTEATSDERRVSDFWRRWPNANIGLVTGSRSGIFVLDIDGEEGQQNLLKLLAVNGELPVTAKQASARGHHYFFSCNEPIKTSAGAIAPKIDIRGEGGYIVAAPSVHPDGPVYTWEVSPEFLSDAPLWLLSEVQTRTKPTCTVITGIPEGQRNETIFKHGLALRSQGMKGREIGAELIAMNYRHCNPPLSDGEVNAIIQNVSQQHSKAKPALFQWRDFIRSPDFAGDHTLRLILHEIGFYMDKNGNGAFPTIEQISAKTALSARTVDRKLKLARESGYLIVKKHQAENQKYANNVYLIPASFYPSDTQT